MEKKYYYFIAGLPLLSLDDYKEPFRVAELSEELSEILCAPHRDLVNLVLSFWDHRNLLDLLFDQDFNLFRRTGLFSKEDLKSYLSDQKGGELSLSGYLHSFLEEFSSLDAQGKRDRAFAGELLSAHFIRQISTCGNRFLEDYFVYDFQLRRIVADLNRRRFSPESVQDGARPGRDSDVDRFDAFAFEPEEIDRLTQAHAKDDPLALEKLMDILRWGKIDALTVLSYFEIEVILGFLLKLMMAQRWADLQAGQGAKMLSRRLEIAGS